MAMGSLRYSPAPGEDRTIVIIWDETDERVRDDPRYWWTEEEVARLRQLDPNIPVTAGRPKGQTLASLREKAEGGRIVWGPFGERMSRVEVFLSLWEDADSERTRFIVAHQRGTPLEERDAPNSLLPPAVEEARQMLRAAIKVGNEEQIAKSREQLTTLFREHGGRKATDLSPWDPERAVEIQPGVFVQDERPGRAQGA